MNNVWLGGVLLVGLLVGTLWAEGPEEKALTDHEVLEFLEARFPDRRADLDELKEENPEEYREELEEAREHVRYVKELEAKAPAVAQAVYKADQLEHDSWELAEKIEGIRDRKARERETAKLRIMLDEIFDARMKERQHEIDEFTKEVADMKAVIEKRRAARKKIVDRHLREMIGGEEEDELGWW